MDLVQNITGNTYEQSNTLKIWRVTQLHARENACSVDIRVILDSVILATWNYMLGVSRVSKSGTLYILSCIYCTYIEGVQKYKIQCNVAYVAVELVFSGVLCSGGGGGGNRGVIEAAILRTGFHWNHWVGGVPTFPASFARSLLRLLGALLGLLAALGLHHVGRVGRVWRL